MIKEFCAENFTNIPAAIASGASRIELCDNLAVGGTTPSLGVIEETLRYTEEKSIPVMVMIRPRGGDFIYNDIEIKIMENDILHAKNAGADGVVFGCLKPEHLLDEEALETLLIAAEGMQITFHMAFDEIPQEQQQSAIDWLAEHNVDRILTHGGPLSESIEDHLTHVKQLISWADSRLTILPGGGITKETADKIATELNVQEVHGTKIV